MAVTYKNRQVIIPAANVSSNVLLPGRVYVKSVKRVGTTLTSGGEMARIKDISGNIYWEDIAAGGSYTASELIEDWWLNGIVVDTLTTGTLYITYG